MEDAKSNIFQGQLRGPFTANTELMNLINEQCVSTVRYVKHLGIQTETHNILIHPEYLIKMKINNKETTIEVGKTGIYELSNTEITSIQFLNDRDNNTVIDYTAVLK